MPEKMLARPLKFWEQICSNMGVTMGFELEGKVTATIVSGAFAHIQKEYPFLRTVLKQDKNQLSFVEATPVSSFRTSCSVHGATAQQYAFDGSETSFSFALVSSTVAMAVLVAYLTSLRFRASELTGDFSLDDCRPIELKVVEGKASA